MVACNNNTEAISQLKQIASYSIDVPEPSGLAINNAGNVLYTVSDETNKIYKLSTTGTLLQTYNFEGNDLEGISFSDNKLYVVEERNKNIIEFSMLDGATTVHSINYSNNELNSGIEGVAYNLENNTIYFLNEKNPGKLFILNSNYTIVNDYKLNFALDYSGLYYDYAIDKLWIISDESQTINKCTLEGDLIESFYINVNKPEGIAVTNTKIFIVSDSQEKLFIFNKPN